MKLSMTIVNNVCISGTSAKAAANFVKRHNKKKKIRNRKHQGKIMFLDLEG